MKIKNLGISKIEEPIKILIADDDASMRMLLNSSISRLGYTVIEAHDGNEAWKIMQKDNPPSLLLLDWIMPEIDGLTLCKLIRERFGNDPYIIFITQVSGSANVLLGFEAGADEFILKPVNFVELQYKISSAEKIINYRKMINFYSNNIEFLVLYIGLLEKFILMQNRTHDK